MEGKGRVRTHRPSAGKVWSAPAQLRSQSCPRPPAPLLRQIKEIRSAARAFGAWGDVVSRPPRAPRAGAGMQQRCLRRRLQSAALLRGRRWVHLSPFAPLAAPSHHPAAHPPHPTHTPPPSPPPPPQVIFLKDGSRLELAGLERFDDLVAYMESRRDALGAER